MQKNKISKKTFFQIKLGQLNRKFSSYQLCHLNFCLRPSGSETYKSACPSLPPSLPDWLPPSLPQANVLKLRLGDFSDLSPAVLTHQSLMQGLWNFNRAPLTTRQLMSGDLTFLCQQLTAVISCLQLLFMSRSPKLDVRGTLW